MKITLPRWYDLHVHFRQGEDMESYIKAHLSMGCAGVLAMPNTKPPVAKVFQDDPLPVWSIEEYRGMLLDAGSAAFSVLLIPLYLSKHTTASMIEAGAKAGLLQVCKYYPPHGTTNAELGQPLSTYIENGVFRAMEENGVVLSIHGEEHGLASAQYFDKNTNAEDYFYRERMPRLRNEFPNLKIVCEHITTETAVSFVKQAGDKTGATITPQHLLYSVGDLLKGFKYHLYCLPLIKFESDRLSLVEAVNDIRNVRFFAGTDSAPHTEKMTECGCAAGCYTGGVAPQLYIKSFDLKKGQDAFEAFLCHNGVSFYNLPKAGGTFTMIQQPQEISSLDTYGSNALNLPQGMGEHTLDWTIAV